MRINESDRLGSSRFSWLASLLLIGASGSAFASGAHDLDGFVAEAMKQWSIPGMAVAVVKDGRIVFAQGYGVRQIGRADRVDENTAFGVGSVTKSFSAAAAAMLVDDGKLAFDAPIIDYIPALYFGDPWITAHAVIRDLTSHRLGIDGYATYIMHSGSLDRTVEEARYIKPNGPYRDFLYSNTGYGLLGKVIENVSGRSWDDFITRRILEPLGMDHSHSSEYAFIAREKLAKCWICVPPKGTPMGIDALENSGADAAVPHGLVATVPQGGGAEPQNNGAVHIQVLPWRSERAVVSAGMVYSTAQDMAQWMMLHLSSGEYHGRQLVSVAQMKELHSPQVLVPAGFLPIENFKLSGYGMGWYIGDYRGLEISEHSGGRVGFGADVWLLPGKRLGVVVLENLDYRDGIPLFRIASRFVDYYLGIPVSKEAERHSLERPAPRKPVGTRPAECSTTAERADMQGLQRAAGAYRSELLGDAQIEVDAKRLAAVFEPGSVADLVPAAGRRTFTACFRGYEQMPTPLGFTYGEAGAVTGFVLGADEPNDPDDRHELLQSRIYFKRIAEGAPTSLPSG